MIDEEEKEAAWRADGKTAGRLWGDAHEYHCSETNYDVGPDKCPVVWPYWSAFKAEFGDSDLDMNLVVRWDWEPAIEAWNGNATETLRVFMIHQRKGRFVCHKIENMKADDEPQVRAYLAQHWQKLTEIWQPLSKEAAK